MCRPRATWVSRRAYCAGRSGTLQRLRREVAKLKAERDILKAAAYFARDAT